MPTSYSYITIYNENNKISISKDNIGMVKLEEHKNNDYTVSIYNRTHIKIFCVKFDNIKEADKMYEILNSVIYDDNPSIIKMRKYM